MHTFRALISDLVSARSRSILAVSPLVSLAFECLPDLVRKLAGHRPDPIGHALRPRAAARDVVQPYDLLDFYRRICGTESLRDACSHPCSTCYASVLRLYLIGAHLQNFSFSKLPRSSRIDFALCHLPLESQNVVTNHTECSFRAEDEYAKNSNLRPAITIPVRSGFPTACLTKPGTSTSRSKWYEY